MYIAKLRLTDGSTRELPVTMSGNSAILRKKDIPADTDTIDMLPDFCNAKTGSKGLSLIHI